MAEEKWWPSLEDYDPGLTKEDWKELFKDKKVFNFGSMCIMKRILDFGGDATCVELAEKYGRTFSSYNLGSSQLAKRVLRKTKCKMPPSNFFPVLFIGRGVDKNENRKGLYIWKLRNELKEALEETDLSEYPLIEPNDKWKELLRQFKIIMKTKPEVAFDNEKYKWETITECADKNGNDILSFLITRNSNLVDSYARTEGKLLLEKEEFSECINDLTDESKDLFERINTFKTTITSFYKDKKRILNDERTASVFLTCKNPEKYTFYKDSYYSSLCKYLEIDSEVAGEKYEHYMSLISEFVPVIESDSEIMSFFDERTNNLNKSKNLIAQNIIYVLFESGKNLVHFQGESNMSKTEELKGLLESNHNLILHGAPGTGKTHLAKEIAAQMICKKSFSEIEKDSEEEKAFNEQTEFVQFHPSYDYSDFVEGLRPVEGDAGQVGFERKDGVFKEFCTKALRKQNRGEIDNFQEALNKFLQVITDEEDGVEIPLLNGNGTFRIKLNSYNDGFVTLIPKKDGSEGYEKDSSRFYNFNQCHRVYQGKPGYLNGGTGFDNYRKAIVKELKKNYGLLEYTEGPETTTQNNNPYIFIIDEINRGELSKIFGELFFSIDPGYRGTKGKVRTQYANMMKGKNEFDQVLGTDSTFGNFFIPDNVYIIGTMNDIDRSVESMDFAMRRRFVFEEVTAEDSAENMNLPQEAIDRMTRINDVIHETEGLGDAYKIGGAYFLGVDDFDQLWKIKISSLIKEYLRGIDDDDSKYKKIEDAYFGRQADPTSDSQEENTPTIG